MLEINKNTLLAFAALADGDAIKVNPEILAEYMKSSEKYTTAAEKFSLKGNELNQRK